MTSKESLLLNKAGVKFTNADASSIQLEKYQEHQKKKREAREVVHMKTLKKHEKNQQDLLNEQQELKTQLEAEDKELARLNREVLTTYPSLEEVENQLLEKIYQYHQSLLEAEQKRLEQKEKEAEELRQEELKEKMKRIERYEAKKQREALEQQERELRERKNEEVEDETNNNP